MAARDVLLTGLPTAALVEVKARTDGLGREMALIVSQREGRPPRLLQVARRLDHLMHALVQLRSAIRAQALAAAGRGDPTLDLQLRVAVDDAERIEAYAEELDAADELARAGGPAVIATAPAARTGRS
ncbi:MAG: hypothetical protein ACJ74O_20470 [Frankiaceae bacterium]